VAYNFFDSIDEYVAQKDGERAPQNLDF